MAAEPTERTKTEELRSNHVKIANLGDFIRAVTRRDARKFFEGFYESINYSIDVTEGYTTQKDLSPEII